MGPVAYQVCSSFQSSFPSIQSVKGDQKPQVKSAFVPFRETPLFFAGKTTFV